MAASTFIARLLGPALLIAGLSLFVHPSFYRSVADDVQRSRALLYLIGMLRFIAGLSIVLVHNVWVADWRVLITLLGWVALIRGAWILTMPETALSLARRVMERGATFPAAAGVAIALGAVLCFFGYF